jgi:putative peptide zinc metalloprotease protein
MKKNIVPLLSKEITFHNLNKNEYFIHQLEYDHRIKISTELYNFIKLIDNQKNIKNIVNEYNLKYNSNLTIEFAYNFLYNKLSLYGIIIDKLIKVNSNQKPSYIKLNFIVINEKIVSRFTKHLNFLFKPKILKTIIIFAIFIFSFSFYNYYYQIIYTNITKSEWVFFFIISFIGVTFHEFGHATAAHYYGAKHGGIGGGFYLFMPVYFADVTDIWKLSKKQRIIVNLAGIYFEIIYILLINSIGLIFNFPILIIFGCIILVSSLRNLNPFIRSDGYWVLSDAIDKPNLMAHGLNKIKQIFKSKTKWSKMDYFILFYGFISYFFILIFLYIVLIKNSNSIIYFPQNIYKFIQKLNNENAQFAIVDIGKLLIPIMFFYLIFGLLKSSVTKTIGGLKNYYNLLKSAISKKNL